MSKISLSNVTFNIPVKIDFPDRLENLQTVVEYLQYHFDTNIIIYEVTPDESKIKGLKGVKHVIEQSKGPFHRTRYLNEMALMSRTPYIVNYDCDVLFKPDQYTKTVEVLSKNNISGCFPYDGLFVNAPRYHISKIRETHNLDSIDIATTENFGNNSMGGAIFWKKRDFIKGGMENENFISWGYEDWERIDRFKKMGIEISRIRGALIHLSHPRAADSCDANPYYQSNGKLYDTMVAMNTPSLRQWVKDQPWMDIFK